jgi:hypothetical protein
LVQTVKKVSGSAIPYAPALHPVAKGGNRTRDFEPRNIAGPHRRSISTATLQHVRAIHTGRLDLNQDLAAVRRAFSQSRGRISPDGKWVAYLSNESGRNEVYVQPLTIGADPGAAATRWQISTSTSGDMAWRADSRALYFEDRDTGRTSGISEASLTTDTARVRWSAHRQVVAGGVARALDQGLDAAKDGRFLILQSGSATGEESAFTVTVNWPALLRRP